MSKIHVQRGQIRNNLITFSHLRTMRNTNLNFNMSWIINKFFYQQTIITKTGGCFLR